jgi:hypothetical protein
VPLAFLAKFALHARHNLPDNLTASGDMNAAFGFHSHNGVRNWHGAGMSSPFLLQSSSGEKPFPVSSIRFHIGPPDEISPILASKNRRKQSKTSQGDVLTIETFSVQLGPSTTLEVQGTADGKGYWIGAKGLVPLERLVALGQVTGFRVNVSNTTASVIANLNITGPWANFAPSQVNGTAHLQNAAAWIPGIKDRLLISEADAQLSQIETVLTHLTAQFEHTPVSVTGTISQPWVCQPAPPCPLEFDLHSDSLSLADVGSLFAPNDKGWNLPFLSDSSNKLPDFRAAGTFSADQLQIAELPLENFKARVEVGDKKLTVTQISARLAGGSADGEWSADWSASKPHFVASGSLTNVALDKMKDKIKPPAPDLALVTSWVAGRTNLKYSVKFDGPSTREMISSAGAHIEFAVNNGSSRTLVLDGNKPLKFERLQGSLQLEKQTLRVLESKFRTENRIYDLSGTVSLADKQAKLKLSNGGSHWEITGALDKPEIAAHQPAARTAAARTR